MAVVLGEANLGRDRIGHEQCGRALAGGCHGPILRDCRASFTQRPYNYPDLFVSILEFGIAALVAAVLNYFFQGTDHERQSGL